MSLLNSLLLLSVFRLLNFPRHVTSPSALGNLCASPQVSFPSMVCARHTAVTTTGVLPSEKNQRMGQKITSNQNRGWQSCTGMSKQILSLGTGKNIGRCFYFPWKRKHLSAFSAFLCYPHSKFHMWKKPRVFQALILLCSWKRLSSSVCTHTIWVTNYAPYVLKYMQETYELHTDTMAP
jgi:hypothetical protein